MTELEKAARQALEALELAQDNLRDHGDNCFLHDEGEYNRCFCGKDSLSNHLQSVVEKLDEALNAPLAEQPAQQEPVAWMFEDDEDNGHKTFRQTPPSPEAVAYLAKWSRPAWVPLYTSPPSLSLTQRKPLTDEEIAVIAAACGGLASDFVVSLSRAIEAAHGIKGDA